MTDLEVVAVGPSVLVQDLGRPGWAHLGVSPAGALDVEALRLANRLVGNPEDAAGLEVLMGGLVLRAGSATRMAVTGAGCPVTVSGRPVGWGEAVSLRAGEELRLGPPVDGLRSYVCVAGGLDLPPVLDSRSTDTLSGLGPPAVGVGDRMSTGAAGDAAAVGQAVPERRTGGARRLRLRLGPRDDWFSAASIERLFDREYVVTSASDRVAVRLDGELLERVRTEELQSEGLVTGGVQVPGNGLPLVFLNDHPVTGGYPVVGVVAAADLGHCAQARPGEKVRFTRV